MITILVVTTCFLVGVAVGGYLRAHETESDLKRMHKREEQLTQLLDMYKRARRDR